MKNRGFTIFNYIFFGVLAFVMVYPFWYAFLSSVVPYSDLMQRTLPIIPTKFDFSAYKEILVNGLLGDAYLTTIKSTFIGLALSLAFTVSGAYVLSIEKLPGAKIISSIIILTMFFSGGLIPMYILLSDLKLINNFWVYVIPSLINTVYMFIIRTSFTDIPLSLREAAEIDGASECRIMLTIYVRLSLPTIMVIGLFYAVDKWNELYTALYFIIDYKLYTLQAALYNLLNANSGTGVDGGAIKTVDEQVKYSAVILTILPIILVYPFLQKYFTKGVLLGSVKE